LWWTPTTDGSTVATAVVPEELPPHPATKKATATTEPVAFIAQQGYRVPGPAENIQA
jgi:hypothetical protein